MARKSTIASTALELIAADGPQDSASLARGIADLGLIRARDPERSLLSAIERDTRFIRGQDRRWYSLSIQLDGAILTHRVTWFERCHQLILLNPSDWLLSRLVAGRDIFRSADGTALFISRVDRLFDLPEPEWEDETWFRPQAQSLESADYDATVNFLNANWDREVIAGTGWLDEVQVDQLIAFSVSADEFEVRAVPAEAVSSEHVERAVSVLRNAARRIAGSADYVMVENLVAELVTTDRELFLQPLLPLDELTAAAALVLDFDIIDLRRRHLPGTDVANDRNDHYYDQMATRINATEAKARLLALLDRVGAGEEIEITRHGRTVARLVPAAGSVALRGSLSGKASSAPDDALLYSTGESWEAA